VLRPLGGDYDSINEGLIMGQDVYAAHTSDILGAEVPDKVRQMVANVTPLARGLCCIAEPIGSQLREWHSA